MATRKKKASAKKVASKKVASKKTATKKTASKKVASKKAVAAPQKLATSVVKEAMTKSQMYTLLAEETGLTKKDITGVFDSYTNLINRHIRKNAVGEFKMPGLFKIKVVKKPAKKARKGVNPFTGEEMMFKAKPARNVVKILPLKAVKDMV